MTILDPEQAVSNVIQAFVASGRNKLLGFTSAEIIESLGISAPSRSASMCLAGALKKMGWAKARSGEKRLATWYPPEIVRMGIANRALTAARGY